MGSWMRHVVVPASMSAIFFSVAFTPVEVLGCRTRGLLALLVALVSGLSGIVTASVCLKRRVRGEADAAWWMVSSLLLTIPVVALILMA